LRAKDEQVDWTGDQLKRFGVRYLVGVLHRDREHLPACVAVSA
jgi:hypothetical protein